MTFKTLWPFAIFWEGPWWASQKKKKRIACIVNSMYVGDVSGVHTLCGKGNLSHINLLPPDEMLDKKNMCPECRAEAFARGYCR